MLNYEDRLKIYKEEYNPHEYGIAGKHSFKLISLLCILTKGARKKTPTVKVEDVLAKCGVTREEYFDFVEKLSLNCDALIANVDAQFDNYGYTKATDMVTEIKAIMEMWLPF